MDATKGFHLGEATHPWGTRFDALVPDFGGKGYATAELPCTTAYGFATIYAELTAPRPDRPVMSVAYELAASGATPKQVFAGLVIYLGQPTDIDRSEVPQSAQAEDSVVLHANWQRPNLSVGLSLYGAPRPSDFGDGAGKLYVSWGDVDAATKPFIGAWRAANEELARAAQAPGALRTFVVAYPINPLAAPRCLHHPEILETPQTIAARLGPTGFALWSNAAGTRWHLSTATDSLVLGTPDSSTVQVMNIAPAKGGGFAMLEVSPWFVRDAFRSGAIADAVRELEKLPGLTFERHEGYDT